MAQMPASSSTGVVLFDVDGTLVDSDYLHVWAWLHAFHAVGRPVDAVAIHHGVGMGSSQMLQRLLGDEAERLGERAKEVHTARYRETFPLLRAFPGAVDLLATVAASAKVVLATSAQPEEFAELRKVLGADEFLSATTCAEDVDAAKPDPDLVQVALDKAQVGADEAIFVGDTVWDVEAAAKAGVACVCVSSGGVCEDQLLEAGALAVYRDVADLGAHLESSPLAKFLGRGVDSARA